LFSRIGPIPREEDAMSDRNRWWDEDRYGREDRGYRNEARRRGARDWDRRPDRPDRDESLPAYRGYLPDTVAWPRETYEAAYGPGDYGRAYGGRGRPANRDRFGAARETYEREPAASHRGKGPKGYARSDERIREDVSDRMWLNSWLDASDVEVSVSNGEVTLAGTVPSREEKRRAEDIAESVPGVTHVQNNLRVRGAGSSAAPGMNRTEPGSSGYASDTVAASEGEPGTGGRGGIDIP
jgi:hypothetical protein